MPVQTDTLAQPKMGSTCSAPHSSAAECSCPISVCRFLRSSQAPLPVGSRQPVNLPYACPQSGQTLDPLTIQHPYPTRSRRSVASMPPRSTRLSLPPRRTSRSSPIPAQRRAPSFPTTCQAPGGAAGTLNYITLIGGNAVTAPLAGAFSLDDKLFFVSTAGDNLIHFINTTTLQDTQQINPNLPACTPGSDPDCLITTPHHELRVRQLRLLSSRARPPSKFLHTRHRRPASCRPSPCTSIRSAARPLKNQPLQHDRIKG